MTCSRRRISPGRKSRVPPGGLVLIADIAHVVESIADVPIGVRLNVRDFRVTQRALHFTRTAHDERALRHFNAFHEQGAGGDDRPGPDVRTVQQNRAHANEALVFNSTAVHDRAVADGHVVADCRRMRLGHDMDDGAVLNVAAAADFDPVHIAADDHAHPDAALFADLHFADHLRTGIDEYARVDTWHAALVLAYHGWSLYEGRKGWIGRTGRKEKMV